MIFRKFALYASPLALLVFLFWWFSGPDSSEEESLPSKEATVEEVCPLSTPGKTPEVESSKIPEALPKNARDEQSALTTSNSFGGPIAFENLSMSELEEINLANAGEEHSHKIREWRGRLEPSLSALKAKLEAEGEDGVLAISLPDASQIQVTRMRYEGFGANQGVFTGKILGDTFGEVVLSYVNQAVAGSIHDYRNDAVWEIRNAGEGRQYIAQVDVTALGECGVCKEHAER